jgi:hypothetical protein
MGKMRMAAGSGGRRGGRRTQRGFLIAAGVAVPALAAALVTGPALAAGSSLAAARSAPGASSPLSRAASGWALAMYATGRDPLHSRDTLYLTSPAGAKYAVHVWPHGTQWQLAAWSPDGSRALFELVSVYGGPTRVEQMTLASGKTTTAFTLPVFSRVLGYALPAGRSVLVAADSGIYRYSLTGTKLARLSAVSGQAGNLGSGGAVMSRSGREIVVPARSGLSLVSPAGVVLRRLRVPHTRGACLPVRWNSPGVVVATCTPTAQSAGPQVFRVPVSGAAPVAVTAVGSFTSGDYGEVDAWTIGKATYVQAEQSCGAGFLGRLNAAGSVVPVSIPGNPESTVVDGVHGHRLLITETGCENRNRLVMFTLPSRTARTILPYGHGAGDIAVVPFDRDGSQP